MQTALTILVALCVVELVHNAIEVWGMRQKVSWLSSTRRDKVHGHWPVNINTGLKTIILHGYIIGLVGGLSILTLGIMDLSQTRLVTLGITTLLFNYIFTTWHVDKFHNEISQEINVYKKLR